MLQRQHLKIFKPAQQGNTPNSGGARSVVEVQNGKLNEIFGSISNIDHGRGAVDIEKFYPAVYTSDRARLKGAHIYISKPPTDPMVSAVLVDAALTDADKLPQMRDKIESAVTAGAVLRQGLSAMAAGQNVLLRDDVLRRANSGEPESVLLGINDIICVVVDYPGAEDLTWPRMQHFARIVDEDDSFFRFEPALAFATPAPSVSINGKNACASLRAISSGQSVKYHGVTALTAAVSSGQKVLQVHGTVGQLLPFASNTTQITNQPIVQYGNIALVHQAGSQQVSVANGRTVTILNDRLLDVSRLVSTGLSNDVIVRYVSRGASIVERVAPRKNGAGTNSTFSITISSEPDVGSMLEWSSFSERHYTVFSATNSVGPGAIAGTVVGNGIISGNRVVFREINGKIYKPTNGTYVAEPAAVVGQIDFATGAVTWDPQVTDGLLEGLKWTGSNSTSVSFLMPFNPVNSTFYVQFKDGGGLNVSASAQANGVINGAGVTGSIDGAIVTLNLGTGIDIRTIRYDVMAENDVLPPAELYQLTATRLPNAGRVSLFNRFGVIVLSDKQLQTILTPSAGASFDVRAGAYVELADATGKSLWTPADEHFYHNKELNKVQLRGTFNGFTAPFVLSDTLSEEGMVTAVDAQRLSLAAPLSRSYPAGATVSSALVLGDLQSRVTDVFDMTSWSGNWLDRGTPANGSLNVLQYPIQVTNDGAINEQWCLIFTSHTAFRVVGEGVGQVGIGDTTNDLAPLNTITNKPFFTIPAAAFGAGWQAGECIRFGTVAASKPAMMIRTVSPGHSTIDRDSITLMFRGNED